MVTKIPELKSKKYHIFFSFLNILCLVADTIGFYNYGVVNDLIYYG